MSEQRGPRFILKVIGEKIMIGINETKVRKQPVK